jgi:hypothetical protein
MIMRRTWTDDQLIEAVALCTSRAEVCRKLGLVPIGGNYKTVNHHVSRLGLETSHWTGLGTDRVRTGSVGRPIEELLTYPSHHSSYNLKKRLIKEGILQEVCSRCKNTEWLGIPISLELEHINGDNRDNRRSNLCLLCPNCHSQTDTYRGKNMKRNN